MDSVEQSAFINNIFCFIYIYFLKLKLDFNKDLLMEKKDL